MCPDNALSAPGSGTTSPRAPRPCRPAAWCPRAVLDPERRRALRARPARPGSRDAPGARGGPWRGVPSSAGRSPGGRDGPSPAWARTRRPFDAAACRLACAIAWPLAPGRCGAACAPAAGSALACALCDGPEACRSAAAGERPWSRPTDPDRRPAVAGCAAAGAEAGRAPELAGAVAAGCGAGSRAVTVSRTTVPVPAMVTVATATIAALVATVATTPPPVPAAALARRQARLGPREQMGEQRRPDRRRKGRRQRGEVGRTLGERGLELPAGTARAHVRAHAPAAQHAAVAVRQCALDVSAEHRPALGALLQPRARLEDRLLDRARRAVEHAGDLLVRQPAQLAQHERHALALGQVAQVRAQQRQSLAVLQRLRQGIGPDRADRIQVHHVAALAQPRDRLVVGDPEQPRAQLEVAPLVAQGRQRLGHRALQRIARVLVVVQDRAAVAIEGLVMALVHRRQRRRVRTRRLRAQRGCPPPSQRRCQPGGRHLFPGHTPHIGNALALQESGASMRTVGRTHARSRPRLRLVSDLRLITALGDPPPSFARVEEPTRRAAARRARPAPLAPRPRRAPRRAGRGRAHGRRRGRHARLPAGADAVAVLRGHGRRTGGRRRRARAAGRRADARLRGRARARHRRARARLALRARRRRRRPGLQHRDRHGARRRARGAHAQAAHPGHHRLLRGQVLPPGPAGRRRLPGRRARRRPLRLSRPAGTSGSPSSRAPTRWPAPRSSSTRRRSARSPTTPTSTPSRCGSA